MARKQIKVQKWKLFRKRKVLVKEWDSIVEAMKDEKLGHGTLWRVIKTGKETNGHVFTAESHLARRPKKRANTEKPGYFDIDEWAEQFKD